MKNIHNILFQVVYIASLLQLDVANEYEIKDNKVYITETGEEATEEDIILLLDAVENILEGEQQQDKE